ncbi:type II 3-dehydroquinate dehydratase [Buchnera aphidicola (Therioaphis trifolii)]|uniref:3-dehydroquinate dehydratase n=2 Tax=Buchnera aphidicola TaxID=9 RepID=A0A4D6YDV3_9GAMM|nr:type II 3-dehydroquinate dehydratase [Buchnera aphidicola]QCI27262.1 type II 3-dehydroquinate dehydratase [Buchnera aphidicola (Therioaphis trifolii)]
MINYKILLLNGPNLNLLGNRESNIYGNITLEKVLNKLNKKAIKLKTKIKHIQSNAEYILINEIHQSKKYDYIIINPGAFTHTSIALRDALLAIKTPFIEVHISNIFAREKFRSHSWLSDISNGIISGLGIEGYYCALYTIIKRLNNKKKKL